MKHATCPQNGPRVSPLLSIIGDFTVKQRVSLMERQLQYLGATIAMSSRGGSIGGGIGDRRNWLDRSIELVKSNLAWDPESPPRRDMLIRDILSEHRAILRASRFKDVDNRHDTPRLCHRLFYLIAQDVID